MKPRPRATALAVLGAGMLVAGCAHAPGAVPPPPAPVAGVDAGRLVEWPAMAGEGLLPRRITIWVPPGYDTGRGRYPVIYAADGQNLFVPGAAFGGQEWGLDEAIAARIARGAPGAIVVGVWNSAERRRDYLPDPILAALPDAVRSGIERANGGSALGDAYVRFLTERVKPRVDAAFRTRTGRADTLLLGSSMGGLIAFHAIGTRPDVFGRAAALSIHWPLTTTRDAVPPPDAVAAAYARWLAGSRFDPAAGALWLDRGTEGLDASYAAYAAALEPVFAARFGPAGAGWAMRRFPGTGHNEADWRARLDAPLDFLLATAPDRVQSTAP